MVRWGQVGYSEDGDAAAASAYRPDLYRHGPRRCRQRSAADDVRIEGAAEDDRFMDGHVFDPAAIERYVETFRSAGAVVVRILATTAEAPLLALHNIPHSACAHRTKIQAKNFDGMFSCWAIADHSK